MLTRPQTVQKGVHNLDQQLVKIEEPQRMQPHISKQDMGDMIMATLQTKAHNACGLNQPQQQPHTWGPQAQPEAQAQPQAQAQPHQLPLT
eukprot:gene19397-26049_t